MKQFRILIACSIIVLTMASFGKQNEFEADKVKLQKRANLLKEYFAKSHSRDSLIRVCL
jgi:hypothetical protein